RLPRFGGTGNYTVLIRSIGLSYFLWDHHVSFCGNFQMASRRETQVENNLSWSNAYNSSFSYSRVCNKVLFWAKQSRFYIWRGLIGSAGPALGLLYLSYRFLWCRIHGTICLVQEGKGGTK